MFFFDWKLCVHYWRTFSWKFQVSTLKIKKIISLKTFCALKLLHKCGRKKGRTAALIPINHNRVVRGQIQFFGPNYSFLLDTHCVSIWEWKTIHKGIKNQHKVFMQMTILHDGAKMFNNLTIWLQRREIHLINNNFSTSTL